jgi:mannitol/fructose-specific phosphotransferase system IIA component (Ntr-type)
LKEKIMRISEILDKKCIKIPLTNMNKNKIIKELLTVIAEAHSEIDKHEAFEGLLEREKIETTAIGHNVAIPHARIKNLPKVYFAFGIIKEGAIFDSIDNQPVNLVFLILFPEEEVSTQLSVLARLSRLLKDETLRNALLECSSSQCVIDVFAQYEAKHFS